MIHYLDSETHKPLCGAPPETEGAHLVIRLARHRRQVNCPGCKSRLNAQQENEALRSLQAVEQAETGFLYDARPEESDETYETNETHETDGEEDINAPV